MGGLDGITKHVLPFVSASLEVGQLTRAPFLRSPHDVSYGAMRIFRIPGGVLGRVSPLCVAMYCFPYVSVFPTFHVSIESS